MSSEKIAQVTRFQVEELDADRVSLTLETSDGAKRATYALGLQAAYDLAVMLESTADWAAVTDEQKQAAAGMAERIAAGEFDHLVGGES